MTVTATRASARKVVRPRRTPRWWADATGTAMALTLVIVTALWVRNRGVQELVAGPGPGLTSAGRLTGLLAADLMLLQVFLMARVPWIERSFGQGRLARWHRWAGFTSFNLLLAHVVFVTIGYAATGSQGVLGQFWALVTTYPGMLLATAALGLVILVVVTSIRAARRRLRYESWHLLHLYAYLGVGLALPHQLWTGEDFIQSAAARAYWWTIYVLAAGSVVVFRLGVPAWRTLRHRLRVDRVVAEAPGVTSVYLRGRDLDRLPVRAGQFFLWRFLDGPGWSRAHPYSISGPPRSDRMRLTVKNLGDGSARVAKLRRGTRVLIEGPYGRLTGELYRGGGVTMLASGVGVTPLLGLLWELPYGPGEAVLIYRASRATDLAFRGEIEALAARRGVRIHFLLGPRARPGSWVPRDAAQLSDVEVLGRLSPEIASHDVYVCGPEPWADAALAAVQGAGVATDRVHHERFSW
jgi:predicted ferric reductase